MTKKFLEEGGYAEFSIVSTNNNYWWFKKDEKATWVEAHKEGDSLLTVNVSENDTIQKRSTTLVIENSCGKSVELKITQEGKSAEEITAYTVTLNSFVYFPSMVEVEGGVAVPQIAYTVQGHTKGGDTIDNVVGKEVKFNFISNQGDGVLDLTNGNVTFEKNTAAIEASRSVAVVAYVEGYEGKLSQSLTAEAKQKTSGVGVIGYEVRNVELDYPEGEIPSYGGSVKPTGLSYQIWTVTNDGSEGTDVTNQFKAEDVVIEYSRNEGSSNVKVDAETGEVDFSVNLSDKIKKASVKANVYVKDNEEYSNNDSSELKQEGSEIESCNIAINKFKYNKVPNTGGEVLPITTYKVTAKFTNGKTYDITKSEDIITSYSGEGEGEVDINTGKVTYGLNEGDAQRNTTVTFDISIAGRSETASATANCIQYGTKETKILGLYISLTNEIVKKPILRKFLRPGEKSSYCVWIINDDGTTEDVTESATIIKEGETAAVTFIPSERLVVATDKEPVTTGITVTGQAKYQNIVSNDKCTILIDLEPIFDDGQIIGNNEIVVNDRFSDYELFYLDEQGNIMEDYTSIEQ